ncbi:MAG: cytochrome c-type biosis protein CcmH [Thermoleophilaceae bacterium]|nr:cytochrome c-type biosis protein CcmH [Thermoleophilaceae bacterium]
MRRIAVLALAAVLLTIAAPAAACPRTSLGDVEPEVMCIECGVPLDVASDASTAKIERAFITRMVAQCKSKDQIKAALVAQYGDGVLATPKSKGFGLAAWVVPLVAFLAAASLITAAALRWRRRRARLADPAPPSVAADSARLDADLHRYDL